jgi:2-polyprenyl-6-methoxyphenol hydroxylase-like FAD-dependent oxidoreductase
VTSAKGNRIAIVGAGPGGVSAALALLRKGYDVQLYERHTQPKPLGGAALLQKVESLSLTGEPGCGSTTR